MSKMGDYLMTLGFKIAQCSLCNGVGHFTLVKDGQVIDTLFCECDSEQISVNWSDMISEYKELVSA